MDRLPKIDRSMLLLTRSILIHPLFFLGVVIKLACAVSFAGTPLTDLFIPFVNFFADTGNNPYEHFSNVGAVETFPYPAAMLYIMTAAKKLFFFLPDILTYRLPLFAADFTILLVLCSWTSKNLTRVLAFYWLSPVLIYISYVHGQLDAVPVALLFISLYFLFRENFVPALLAAGLSVAAKTSMVLALPLVLIYMISQHAAKKTWLLLAVLPVLSFLLVNAVYFADPAFVQMVFFNKTQEQFFAVKIPYGDFSLYVTPVVYLFLLGQALLLRVKSQKIFTLYIGFAFGIVTLFTIPMQGWFYWTLPFWLYFFIEAERGGRRSAFLVQAAFFFYFLFIPHSDYFAVFKPVLPQVALLPNAYVLLENYGFNAAVVANLALSLLHSVLLLMLFWLYKRGIDVAAQYKIFSRPFLIGIGGNSGSGKTTLSDYIEKVFGKKNITNIKGDDVHKWERGNENWSVFTHLDPRANNIHQEYMDLYALKYERSISRISYDHSTGKFKPLKDRLTPNKIVIYEGLHTLFLKKIRDLFDLKIFMAPDAALAMHWKVCRDRKERGYTAEQSLAQIEKRRADYERYIATQEKHADIRISVCPEQSISDTGNLDLVPVTYLHFRCINTLPLEPLIDVMQTLQGVTLAHAYGDEDYQTLDMHGHPDLSEIQRVGSTLSIFAVHSKEPEWLAGQDGLIQLFIAYAIIQQANIADAR